MKKLSAIILALLFILSGTTVYASEEVSWNLLDLDFTSSDDYDLYGLSNAGIVENCLVPQAGAEEVSYEMDDDHTTYLRVPSIEDGMTLLEGTFYGTLDAVDVSSQDTSYLDITMTFRFRAGEGTSGAHFKLGGSAYRTVVDVYVNKAGNLVIKNNDNVIFEGVNNGEWHVVTVAVKYDESNDSVKITCDEDYFEEKISTLFSHTEAPIMTFLLLKEPNSDPVDVDYIRIRDAGAADDDTNVETTADITTAAPETSGISETESPETTVIDITSAEAAPDVTTGSTVTTKGDTDGGSSALWIILVIAAVVVIAAVIAVIIVKKRKK